MSGPRARAPAGGVRASWRVACVAAACMAALPCAEAQAPEPADETVVLTALPVLFSLASQLTAGTDVVVRNLPPNGRPMSALESYFTLQAERLKPELAAADAVVTMGKLWREDPLYVAARGANIRVVDIDATKPWSATLEGVGLVREPADNVPWAAAPAVAGAAESREPALYYWLSPANGAQAADIVARDLMRLAPREAARIEENLAAFRERVLALKRRYEIELAELPDVTVFALTRDLVYLTTDLGINVDGYFTKQDIDWTDDDARELTKRLRDRDIGVVLHRWEPAEPIAAAIAAAGARLVVLEVGEAGDPSVSGEDGLSPDGYLRLLEADLAALTDALRAAAK